MVNLGTGCIVHRNVKNRCAGNDSRIKMSPPSTSHYLIRINQVRPANKIHPYNHISEYFFVFLQKYCADGVFA